jgi:hypothetical protein
VYRANSTDLCCAGFSHGKAHWFFFGYFLSKTILQNLRAIFNACVKLFPVFQQVGNLWMGTSYSFLWIIVEITLSIVR